jgi:hypothetical protein
VFISAQNLNESEKKLTQNKLEIIKFQMISGHTDERRAKIMERQQVEHHVTHHPSLPLMQVLPKI